MSFSESYSVEILDTYTKKYPFKKTLKTFLCVCCPNEILVSRKASFRENQYCCSTGYICRRKNSSSVLFTFSVRESFHFMARFFFLLKCVLYIVTCSNKVSGSVSNKVLL